MVTTRDIKERAHAVISSAYVKADTWINNKGDVLLQQALSYLHEEDKQTIRDRIADAICLGAELGIKYAELEAKNSSKVLTSEQILAIDQALERSQPRS